MLSVSGWTSWLDVKVRARIAVEAEVKAEGWSWSWSWNGSWSGSWELAEAPKMAAGASPPTDLEKYGLTPQNLDFGPKWRFRLQTPPYLNGFGGVLGHVSKPENVLFAPGSQLYNQRSRWGILTKICISRNPRPRIRVGTPHFHRFPSY